MTTDVKQRFWSKVNIGGTDECWNWATALDGRGYGVIRIDGVQWRSHRVAYILEHGSIPAGLCICHTCDNRKCVNPRHLFTGTQKENIRDMIKKGRQAPSPAKKGEQHGRSKLTGADVLKIRHLHKEGFSYSWLAKKFAVSGCNIGFIVRREHWTHV